MKSVRNERYMKLLERLPEDIQELAEAKFRLFQLDPKHPMLEREDCYDSKRSKLRKGSFAVRIGIHYRAIGVEDCGPDGEGEPQVCWYWIGTRSDYANLLGCR
jgi:hypothetical protein